MERAELLGRSKQKRNSRLKTLSLLTLSLLLAACSAGIRPQTLPESELEITPQATGSFTKQIAASADDAEEPSTGAAYVTSTVLELGEATTAQTTGLRFTSVTIPKGAQITSAYLEFTSVLDRVDPASLTIRGGATDDATVFTATDGGVDGRTRTSASRSWSPGAWSADEVGADTRTPDLSAVVQEVTSRTGWTSGNAISFFITGTGQRKADSFDGNAVGAPKLVVTYSTSTAFKPSLSMTINPNFSVAALKSYDAANGTNAAVSYDRIVRSDGFSRTYSEFTTDTQGPLRVMGREINEDVSTLLLAFRMTGSEQLLDRVHAIMTKSFTSSYFETTSSGYRRWRYDGYPDSALEDTLAHGMVAQAAYAFYLNRNYKSSYASMYAQIKDYLRNDFEKIHEGSGGYNGGSITDKTLFHAYTNFTRYYWYMHLMLKNSTNADEVSDAAAYKVEADRKGNVILEMMKTDSVNSTYVYSHRVWPEAWGSAGGGCDKMTGGYKCAYHMNQYPQETATGFNPLIMDGFEKFSNNAFAQKLSRSYRLNTFNGSPFNGDSNDRVMSSDVGRNSSNPCQETLDADGYHCYAVTTTFSENDPHVAGNPGITLQYQSGDGTKMEVRHALDKNLAQAGIWDTSGEIMAKVETYYNGVYGTTNPPRTFNAPASLLTYDLYKAGGFSLD